MHRAWAYANSARARWAQLYNLPRTDPRYLDATDEDVLLDLVDRMFAAGMVRRADPRNRVAEEAARDVDKLADEQAQLRAMLERAKIGERVHAAMRDAGPPGGMAIVRIKPARIKGTT